MFETFLHVVLIVLPFVIGGYVIIDGINHGDWRR